MVEGKVWWRTVFKGGPLLWNHRKHKVAIRVVSNDAKSETLCAACWSKSVTESACDQRVLILLHTALFFSENVFRESVSAESSHQQRLLFPAARKECALGIMFGRTCLCRGESDRVTKVECAAAGADAIMCVFCAIAISDGVVRLHKTGDSNVWVCACGFWTFDGGANFSQFRSENVLSLALAPLVF